MTKADMMCIIADMEDEDEIDLYEILRDEEQARQDRIDELEERQHQSGFYAFQDMVALRRYER